VGLLRTLLELTRGAPVAVEFRHASWFADPIYTRLADEGAALCIAETEALATPRVATARFGYLRLRKARYGPVALGDWARWIAAQAWENVYAYFKHDAGTAPRRARALLALMAPTAARTDPAARARRASGRPRRRRA
jgi:uncharacterized protein YecE (DUF72 family)